MEITNVNKSDLEGKLTVKVNEKDYAEKVDNELRKLRKTVQLKGFRPGHTPLTLIKKLYGKAVVQQEVDKLVKEAVDNYIKENKLSLVAAMQPVDEETKFDLGKDKDFTFVFEYGKYPDIEIKLEDITLDYYKVKITDHMIDKEIENIKNKFGELKEVEQVPEVDAEDLKNYSVSVKAKELSNKEQSYELKNGYILLGFLSEEGYKEFIGKKKGDKLTLNLKKAFKSDTDLAGFLNVKKEELEKFVDDFEIEILEIKKFEPAELNEELFKKAFPKQEIKSEEEFREQVKKSLEEKNKAVEIDLFITKGRKQLLEQIDFQLPKDFIQKRYPDTQWDKLKEIYKWEYIYAKLSKALDFDYTVDEFYLDVFNQYVPYYQSMGLDIEQMAQSEQDKKNIAQSLLKSMGDENIDRDFYIFSLRKFFGILKDKVKLNVIETEDINKIIEQENNQQQEDKKKEMKNQQNSIDLQQEDNTENSDSTKQNNTTQQSEINK